MANLGIYTGLTKSILKLSHPCRDYVITKVPHLSCNLSVSTERLNPVTQFHIYFSFFNKIFFRKFPSTLTIADATTSHLFEYLTISKRHPLQLINKFINFYRHYVYKCSIFHDYEGSKITQ